MKFEAAYKLMEKGKPIRRHCWESGVAWSMDGGYIHERNSDWQKIELSNAYTSLSLFKEMKADDWETIAEDLEFLDAWTISKETQGTMVLTDSTGNTVMAPFTVTPHHYIAVVEDDGNVIIPIPLDAIFESKWGVLLK